MSPVQVVLGNHESRQCKITSLKKHLWCEKATKPSISENA